MGYRKARAYLAKMAGKFPEFEWELARLATHNWVVRAKDGRFPGTFQDYAELDCIVNL